MCARQRGCADRIQPDPGSAVPAEARSVAENLCSAMANSEGAHSCNQAQDSACHEQRPWTRQVDCEVGGCNGEHGTEAIYADINTVDRAEEALMCKPLHECDH